MKYLVLQGNTGSGKTMILHELKKRGYNILDLEGCANHRGSFLGSVGIGLGYTQKKFESLAYEELRNRKSSLVLVEGESKRIGRVLIPDYIYDSMVESKRLLIDVSLEQRVKNIMKEYTQGEDWKEETIRGLERLEKYISKEEIDKYTEMLAKDQIEEVIKELMETYYDPMYKKGENKYKYEAIIDANDIALACDEIEEWIANNI